jgi:WD40 repeat protein
MKPLPFLTILSLAAAFLASGCLWGVVTDADTGVGLTGVAVTYTDSEGHADWTTTVNGLYAFDIASGPFPAAGPATLEVSAPGYESITDSHVIAYNDNPNASLDNPSSFWEIQHFALQPAAQIAFRSDRDGNYEIYMMNPDGTGQTRLTSNSAYDDEAAWSPDRSRIAFMSNRDGNTEVYVMNADGSGQMNLTNDTADALYPDWSPDGAKIAFTSRRDGPEEIYVMKADGTGQTRLTNHPAWDWCPDW